ncbi:MAG: acyltransferase [Elusimicrobiota bacterium]
MNRFLRKEYEKTRKLPAPKMLIKLIGWIFPFSMPCKIRPWLLRVAGANIGKHIFIGRMCVIDDNFTELLTIEDDVIISYGAMIFCHDRSKPETVLGPVVLKKGCYLGFGCLVLPGVTVGENAIVGAGAVVTKDVPPGVTVVGIPASPIKAGKP